MKKLMLLMLLIVTSNLYGQYSNYKGTRDSSFTISPGKYHVIPIDSDVLTIPHGSVFWYDSTKSRFEWVSGTGNGNKFLQFSADGDSLLAVDTVYTSATRADSATIADTALVALTSIDTVSNADSLGGVPASGYMLKSIGTTKGDIVYWSAGSIPARLGIGDVTEVLMTDATGQAPEWDTLSHSELGGVTTSQHHVKTVDTDTWRDIDDTPVDAITTESISSNWAFDHTASPNAHHIPTVDTYVTGKDAHTHASGDGATIDISGATNLAGGNALTLSGDTMNFDGGASPTGDLSGSPSWADLQVNNDSHTHGIYALTAGDQFTGNLEINGASLRLISTGIGEIGVITQGTSDEMIFSNATGGYEFTGGNITAGVWNGTALTDTYVDNNITVSGYVEDTGDQMTGNLEINGATLRLISTGVGEVGVINQGTSDEMIFSGATGGYEFTSGNITSGTWTATDIGIAHGGTGASTELNARSNLGLSIGSDVQAYSSVLSEFSILGESAGNMIYWSNSTTDWEVRAVGASNTVLFSNGTYPNWGKINNDYWSGTDLALTNGGTGSSTASGARTNLGLEEGALAESSSQGLSGATPTGGSNMDVVRDYHSGNIWIKIAGSWYQIQ